MSSNVPMRSLIWVRKAGAGWKWWQQARRDRSRRLLNYAVNFEKMLLHGGAGKCSIIAACVLPKPLMMPSRLFEHPLTPQNSGGHYGWIGVSLWDVHHALATDTEPQERLRVERGWIARKDAPEDLVARRRAAVWTDQSIRNLAVCALDALVQLSGWWRSEILLRSKRQEHSDIDFYCR